MPFFAALAIIITIFAQTGVTTLAQSELGDFCTTSAYECDKQSKSEERSDTTNTPDPDEMAILAQDKSFIGYFRIPSVGICVPTYHMYNWGPGAGHYAQAYADKENTAIWIEGWTPYIIVADHSSQEFAKLPEVQVGDEAIISWLDGTETVLHCTEIGFGINDNVNLIDQYGVPWSDWDCQFMTYTCNLAIENGIFYAKWQFE